MRSIIKYFILLILISKLNFCFAQQNEIIDSLSKIAINQKDTNQIYALVNLSNAYLNYNRYTEADSVTRYFVTLSTKLNFKPGSAYAQVNFGNISFAQGKNKEALLNYQNSLKLWEQINDQRGVVKSYLNIGNVFLAQQNKDKALEYYQRSYELAKKINYKKNNVLLFLNMGSVLFLKKDYKNSLDFYLKALEAAEKTGDLNSYSKALINMADVYTDIKNFKRADSLFKECIALNEENNNTNLLSALYNNYANLLSFEGKTDEAIIFIEKSIKVSKQSSFRELTKNNYFALAQLYAQKKDYKYAFENYEKYSNSKDSLLNEQNSRIINEVNTKYETEKKDKEIIKKNAETKQASLQRNFFIIAFALMLLSAFFIFRGLKKQRAANKIISKQKTDVEAAKTIIEHQKEIVEEKQKEVMDSIHYARRIQSALITNEKYIEKTLNRLNKNG